MTLTATSHSPVAIHSMRGQRSTSTEEGACSALHDMLDMCWAVCERRQPHLKAQSLEVTSPQHKQPVSVSYFTVVSESDCSCTDGVQQPIVRVHKPTKAFLEGTLVFSSSPSEHQAALFATLYQTVRPQDCITDFHFRVGNGILANCHSGEQYYDPPGRTWKPLILASQLRVANV